jgi:hypothetical protein
VLIDDCSKRLTRFFNPQFPIVIQQSLRLSRALPPIGNWEAVQTDIPHPAPKVVIIKRAYFSIIGRLTQD